MKTIFAAVSILALLSFGCTEKPSKAAEMNRKADSTYSADTVQLNRQYQR